MRLLFCFINQFIFSLLFFSFYLTNIFRWRKMNLKIQYFSSLGNFDDGISKHAWKLIKTWHRKIIQDSMLSGERVLYSYLRLAAKNISFKTKQIWFKKQIWNKTWLTGYLNYENRKKEIADNICCTCCIFLKNYHNVTIHDLL